MPRKRGTIAKLTGDVQELAKVSPSIVQETLLRRGAETWMDGLITELKPGPYCSQCHRPVRARWAYLLFAKACKLVGAEPQVLILTLQRMGVRDVDHLESLVDSGRRFESLKADAKASMDHYIDQATELLVLSLREKPGRRMEVLRRLDAAPISLPELNGHANGTAHP